MVVALTKFGEGAWIIIALIPILVLHFRSVRRHYDGVASELSLKGWTAPAPRRAGCSCP